LREILVSPAMWAVIGYRARRGLYRPRAPRPLRLALNIVSAILQVFLEVITHVTLPVALEIGPGLYIAHSGYIVVNSRARIGSNCTLTQGVTIGHAAGGGGSMGCPTIGDRVYVGPGAILIGPIVVGDDALIGAGAVVTSSVPARGVVAGNPAYLVSRRGSFDLIAYPGMESDLARLKALASLETEQSPDFAAKPRPSQ
jgi:serine O-acetyltransferase